MPDKKINILYLGCSGFPYGLAEVQKIILVSKALILENAAVTVINPRGMANRNEHPDLKKVGHHQGIKYIYSSGSPYRENHFLKRNFNKIVEKIGEFYTIFNENRILKIDAAIVSSMNIWQVLFYRILSKIFNFKLVLNLVESNNAIAAEQKKRFSLSDYIFDNFAVKFCDGVMPISEYLIEIIKKKSPQKKFLKVPVLVDMNRYIGIEETTDSTYFLFCGSVDYKEVISFIIRSFELIDDNETWLYLVINGRKNNFIEVEKVISGSKKKSLIRTFTAVPEKELSILYKGALALLIPLRPTKQDQARFPHKTGEYLASGNPIVTTNYGEMMYYFRDNDNAFVANHYDETEYAQKMNEVLRTPSVRSVIGEKGRITAEKNFDYKIYGKKILEFIDSI